MLLNLLVIHFAFGSPFGIYQIARGDSVRSTRSAAKVAAHFVLWPIFAASFISGWLTNYLKPAANELEQKIAEIHSKIEDAAFSERSLSSVFEFREIFARFTGLTIAVMENGKYTKSKDLLKISGHKNIALASACIARRNQERLSFHLDEARNEFVELISRVSASHVNGTVIIELAKSLAYLIDDHNVANSLSVLPLHKRSDEQLSRAAA